MTVISEGELEFDFRGALHAFKLDDPATHGLSHCMKAVDFVVEYPDFVLFVEVKDPDHSHATADARARFAAELIAGRLCRALTQKYRDAWLYRWAAGADAKPVRYGVLLQFGALQPVALMRLREMLQKALPAPAAAPPSWQRRLVDAVVVMDIAQWNRHGVFGTVRRR